MIHVALRHDVPKVLEGLRHLVLAVERKVDPAIAVPCHSSLSNAITGGKAISNATLRIGERCASEIASCTTCMSCFKPSTPSRTHGGRLCLAQTGAGGLSQHSHARHMHLCGVQRPRLTQRPRPTQGAGQHRGHAAG